MNKTAIEFTDDELRRLAEMCSVIMVLLNLNQDHSDSASMHEWSKLAARLLDTARKAPAISQQMEWNPELKHWYFTPEYVEGAFLSSLLNETRETIFWEELVVRMAERTLFSLLSEEEVLKMAPEERHCRLAALEQALWSEVMEHGIERLVFLLPEEESELTS